MWNEREFRGQLVACIENAKSNNYKFFKFVGEVYTFLKGYIKRTDNNVYKFIRKNENDDKFYECIRGMMDRNVLLDDGDNLIINGANDEMLYEDITNIIKSIFFVRRIEIELTDTDREVIIVQNETYKSLRDKLILEHAELSQRILKLEAFKTSSMWLDISEDERDMLSKQREAMGQYAEVLRQRIEWYRNRIF